MAPRLPDHVVMCRDGAVYALSALSQPPAGGDGKRLCEARAAVPKRDQDCPRIARRIPKIAQGPLGREIALDRQICSCFVTAAKDTCACPGGSTAPPEVPQKGLKQTRNGSEDSSEGPAWLQIGPSAPFTYFHTLFVLSAALPVHCPERFPSIPGRSAAKTWLTGSAYARHEQR